MPAAAFLIAAFLIRLPHLGDPAYHTDEEFYLLMGDRMLHGALPYVDIWDRKPIGLFLLYAAIRLLGGEGIYQYQLVSTLFAAATGFIIYRIARPHAGVFGGAVAGLAYLLWIETVGGGGGQAPIFYNPLMAGAAWAVLRAGDAEDAGASFRLGLIAMALVGLAMQLKYTALFEGLYFGALLAWWMLCRSTSVPTAFARTAALAMTALVPTGLAIAYYAAIGQLHAFWFANFVSIGFRGSPPQAHVHLWFWQDVGHAAILGCCCAAGLWQLHAHGGADARRRCWIMAGWCGAAAVGFASVGMFYCHYLLPLFVPLAAGAGPIFRRWPIGPVLAGIALWLPLRGIDYPDFGSTLRSQQRIETIRALLPPDVRTRCLLVLNAPSIFYYLTPSCTRTRFIFPDHLVSRIEENALGVPAAAELQRVLAYRPSALIVGWDVSEYSGASLAVLRRAQAGSYRRAGSIAFDEGGVDVWVRRP